MRLYGFVLALSVALSAPAVAQGGDHCTHDALVVDGAPIATTLCVSGGPGGTVTVNATYARANATVERTVTIDAVAGAQVSRTVDDVPLAALGSPKRLHVTIAYRSGAAAIERALLLPGAVIVR